MPCACCKAAKKKVQQSRYRAKRAAKNVRVRRICDSFTRWRAHVVGFATRHDYEVQSCRCLSKKAKRRTPLLHIKVTPRTLLARSACETQRGTAEATEASQGTLRLGGFVGAAAAAAASKVPAHRCVSLAAPAHERRLLPRVGARGEGCRASAPAPSLCFPVFRAGRIDRGQPRSPPLRRRRASRRAHRNLEATRRPSGQPHAPTREHNTEPWPCRPTAPCPSKKSRNK